MDGAAAKGHLTVVQYVHAHRSEGCTTAAMDNVATNGHLDVVQFLHSHRSEGCTTKAMDGAAANNHLNVVQFLDDHRTEGCTGAVIDKAATRGHVGIVQFLLANRTEGYTAQAMLGVLSNGGSGPPTTANTNTELVRGNRQQRAYYEVQLPFTRLTERLRFQSLLPPPNQDQWRIYDMMRRHRIQGLAFEAPAHELTISTLRKAMELLQDYKTQPQVAVEVAAKRGDLAVVRMLHIHFHQYYCTVNACVEAADFAQANVVAFLVQHCVPRDSVGRVLLGAVKSGDLATTQAAAEACKRDDLEEAQELATRRGLQEIAEYLTSVILTKMRRCV